MSLHTGARAAGPRLPIGMLGCSVGFLKTRSRPRGLRPRNQSLPLSLSLPCPPSLPPFPALPPLSPFQSPSFSLQFLQVNPTQTCTDLLLTDMNSQRAFLVVREPARLSLPRRPAQTGHSFALAEPRVGPGACLRPSLQVRAAGSCQRWGGQQVGGPWGAGHS